MMLLVYDKLVAKVNNIDINDTDKYDADKSELEKKIPNVTDFVKEAKLKCKTKLQKLKMNLLTIIMINILTLQNLIK